MVQGKAPPHEPERDAEVKKMRKTEDKLREMPVIQSQTHIKTVFPLPQ